MIGSIRSIGGASELGLVPWTSGVVPMKPVTRFTGSQINPFCCADNSGLSQLIVLVLKKSPDGAICATVRSSMNMNSIYGLIAGLTS